MGTSNAGPEAVIEKRRFIRYEIEASVEISQGGGRTAYQTEDLGAGGCRVTVDRPLEKGTEVEIRLTSARTHLQVAGRATVVWASRSEPYRVGLQFSDAVAEQAIGFIHAVLGAVAIHTGEG